MDIRALRPEDLPVLHDLVCRVFGPFFEESFRPTVSETVFGNRHGDWRGDYAKLLAEAHKPQEGRVAAVAVVEGRIAGFVGYLLQKDERHGEIDIIAVLPEARRHGVGKALLDHALTALKAEGVDVVSLGTGGDDFHAPARAFYESAGFTPFPTVSYTMPI
ncbi:GNAT family N-acetyltransferase [Actinokineospora guangxiensis]|uniref:GNAT family N-acetyltransferase n=1 Tax=Actinokineospora guangxiensis TaxID=1490288 RepID=A0ABW0EL85_9PSEU